MPVAHYLGCGPDAPGQADRGIERRFATSIDEFAEAVTEVVDSVVTQTCSLDMPLLWTDWPFPCAFLGISEVEPAWLPEKLSTKWVASIWQVLSCLKPASLPAIASQTR